MSDFRYHVASLAAFFLALVLGILVGVAISDPGLADKVSKERLRDEVARLEARVEEADERAEANEAAQRFVDEAYDAVLADRLAGKRIAIVFVGGVSRDLEAPIVDAVEAAGGEAFRLRSIGVPIDTGAIDGALGGIQELAGLAGPDDLSEVGRRLGEELVAGGETPVSDALTSELVQERSGSLFGPADGVVVVRTAKPQGEHTGRFLRGLYAGLAGSVPAVGVVESGERAIPVFDSTVEDVRTPLGRVSLVVLLAGGSPGHYGTGTGADAPVPPIEPATVVTTGA